MRHWVHGFVVLCVLGCGACASNSKVDPKVQAEQKWNQVRGGVKARLAARQYESGQFAECIRTASEAMALDPHGPESYVLAARAHLELGRPASSQQVLEAARRHATVNADVLYSEAVLLEQRDQLEAAIEKYQEALAKDPTHLDAFIARVECLVACDRVAEASEVLRKDGEDFDDRAIIALLGARLALLNQDEAEANRRYAEALAAAPERTAIVEEYGLYLTEQHQCTAALPLLQNAFQQRGDADFAPRTRQALAACLLESGDAKGATTLLESYAQANPKDGMAHLILAKAALMLGDSAHARRAVQMAEQANVDQAESAKIRALVSIQTKNFAEAQSILEALLGHRPQDWEARCMLADLLAAQQLRDLAAEHFRFALNQHPNCAWATEGLKRCGPVGVVEPNGR